MLAFACLSAACSHSDSFTNPQGTDLPFDAGPPARLTLNGAHDGHAAWLADGEGIVYSSQQLDREDADVCLAELPPTGGSQRRLVCDIPGGESTTDAVQWPAPASDGRIALLSAGNGGIGGTSPVLLDIGMAPGLDALEPETVRILPLTPTGGVQQDYAGYLRWLTETRLVYVGQRFRPLRACPDVSCPLDTLLYGTEVTLLQLADGPTTAIAIPGTAEATGVAAIEDGRSILYTLANDSRVYRRVLSSGEVTVFHDFGPSGTARDVHAAGGRVAAIVGGRVAYGLHPTMGPTQWDSGGVLHLLDLDGEGEVILETALRLYRRPAVSPDGSRVVAEGFPVTVSGPPADPDTTVSKSGDLYLFGGE